MPLSPYMKEKLASAKFSMPTPVQAAAIPQALAGKDVLATAMTGTGKTLAFLVPVIEQLLKQNTPGINALVLVPTRELAMQVVAQYNALRGTKLMPAALVVGGFSEGAQLQATARALASWLPLPDALRIISIAGFSTLIRCACSFSTKQTACWTWVFFPPSAESFHSSQGPPDHVLFRNHGGLHGTRGQGLHEGAGAPHFRLHSQASRKRSRAGL